MVENEENTEKPSFRGLADAYEGPLEKPDLRRGLINNLSEALDSEEKIEAFAKLLGDSPKDYKDLIYKNRPFYWRQMFIGDLEFFEKVLRNPETIFVYDVDGILSNSPKIVLKRFTEKTGIRTNPTEIDRWDYLTNLAKSAGLTGDNLKNAETDWYEPEVLGAAQKYLYITPVVGKTLKYYSPGRNFALTSREPRLTESTLGWFSWKIPNFKTENILIRTNPKDDPSKFKVDNLVRLARTAPWVVFIDDHTDFAKAAVQADIANCLVINAPLGKIVPDFRHKRLIVIKRYPEYLQAMYPLLFLVDRAIGNRSNK